MELPIFENESRQDFENSIAPPTIDELFVIESTPPSIVKKRRRSCKRVRREAIDPSIEIPKETLREWQQNSDQLIQERSKVFPAAKHLII